MWGRDLSWKGKMATFAVTILQQIELDLKATQALVLAAPRELRHRIRKVVIALGDYMGPLPCLHWWYQCAC